MTECLVGKNKPDQGIDDQNRRHALRGITIHSQVCYRVTVDTPKDGAEAWKKDFLDLHSLEEYLRLLSPSEAAKVHEFIGTTRSVGEAHAIMENVSKDDFSVDGFEKLKPG